MAIEYLIKGPVTQAIISQIIENAGKRNDTGGHSIFLGQVRADNINGKFVRAIEYSAYNAMVQAEADKIKELILSEFSDARTVEIVHSTGVVGVGETCRPDRDGHDADPGRRHARPSGQTGSGQPDRNAPDAGDRDTDSHADQ